MTSGWRKRFPEAAIRSDFKQNMKKRGLDPDEMWELFEAHDGLCDICGRPPSEVGQKKRLSVDHDHETGKFRGFICHNCNVALGLVYDSIDTLAAMIDYLMNDGVSK